RTFVLPDLGEGLVEAEIRNVLVKEGDVIKEDSPLLEVETDKAQVEIPSPFAGRVEKIHVQPGQTVKVGQPLVSFGDSIGTSAPTRSAPAHPPPPPPPPRAGPRSPPPRRPPTARRCRPPRRRGGWRASSAWIFVPCGAADRGDASPTTTCAAAPGNPRALPPT